MATRLSGKRIAILATDGVEQSELTSPWEAVLAEGASVELISLKPGSIRAVQHDRPGESFPVDRLTAEAKTDQYVGLILPGGVANPDRLRLDPAAVSFVRSFVDIGKPVAAICHGPWMLVEADRVRGRLVTSWPSLRTDIENAGGVWIDEEVHVDNGIVTSRKPADLPAFNVRLVEEFAEGIHERIPAVAGSGSSIGS